MSHEDHLQMVKKEQSMLINYPIGTKLIVKSNDDQPYRIGIMKGATRMHSSVFPLVEIDEKECMVMGIIRLADPRRTIALDKLTGIEQWNVLAEFHVI